MEKVLVLDFGGQYNQLIARRVRDLHVFAEIKSYKTPLSEIKNNDYKGIIFTGGPNSVYDEASPKYDKGIFELGIPILGICYGHQLLSFLNGGEVTPSRNGSEYGKTKVYFKDNILFKDIKKESICFMSHTDYVSKTPAGFSIIAYTDNCPCAGIANDGMKLYGVQFHPEVTHTEYGQKVLSNFLFEICGLKGDYLLDDFVKKSIDKYREELKDKKVLLALSGGVDSSVVAALLNEAIGHNLICVFVDHGLLRKNEAEFVEKVFKEKFNMNFVKIDARDRFLSKLIGITEPEKKRKIIGEEFIRVFEDEAKKIGEIDYLAQGTIYPDVVESGSGSSATIKSHHNVGGLPKNISFKGIVEPLRSLFKDEVRAIGLKLGLPDELVYRQPFPGPGLGVRVIGEITKEKLDILKEADAIFREELEKTDAVKFANQYFAVITNVKSVGVMGDFRTYGYTIVLRSVTTDDFMTAEWTRIPYETLSIVSNRITNEIKGVTRVTYDITSKPPATIEWE